MIYFAEYLPNGKYVAKGLAQTRNGITAHHGGAIYIGSVDPLTHRHDIERDSPVELPPRPSVEHVFDHDSGEWVDPRSENDLWGDARRRRDALLSACDWVTLRAQERGEPVLPEWLAYRQALRDITQQGVPWAIVWPTPP